MCTLPNLPSIAMGYCGKHTRPIKYSVNKLDFIILD